MNYSTIKWVDVANGEGMRMSLFVSGCKHACPQCFNEEAWDFGYGSPYTNEIEEEILERLGHDYIRGLSLLGGEPLDPRNQSAILNLVERAKKRYPEKDIWCYTGYRFEELDSIGDLAMEILSYIDVLVDGKFVASLKNLSLAFRGSENQRIIDVAQSLEGGSVVLDLRYP
ncbi:MAG: anaerobic ribonucleoside-triphosphate reductase activating protein [Eubacteriales bacterium]